MTTSPLVAQISRIITLSEPEQTLINTWFRPQTLRSGDYWLREGQICRYVGFIESGLLRYTVNHDGDELTYSFGGSLGLGYGFALFGNKQKTLEIQATYQQLSTRVEVNGIGDDQWRFGALSLSGAINF